MASEFTLRQARCLVAAVEAGSMAAASRTLHVSASAVSLAISELEQSLASPLLIRAAHRPLALTPTGSRLIGDMRRLLAAADDIMSASANDANGDSGPLVVGCFSTLAPLLVPRMVAAVVDRYPRISLTMHEMAKATLQQAVLEGRVEIGILYDDDDLHPDLDRTELVVYEPYILVWAGHRLVEQGPVHLEDLRHDPMVMLDLPPSRQLFGGILADAGITPNIVRISQSFETVRSLVARQQGWSMLIQKPSIDISYEGLPLRCLPIANRTTTISAVAVWPHKARLTKRAELFLALCREDAERTDVNNNP